MPDEVWLLFDGGDGSICDASPTKPDGKRWVHFVRADLAIPAELAGLIEAVDAWNEAEGRGRDMAHRSLYRALDAYITARAKEKANG